MKAIGIVAVVAGHCGAKCFAFLRPYYFHMPLFFFLGGLLFNQTTPNAKFIKNVFTKYIAYIIYSYAILWVLVYLFSGFAPIVAQNLPRVGIVDQVILSLQNNMHYFTFFMVSWFLVAYALVSCSAYLILKLGEKSSAATGKFYFFLALLFGVAGMSYFAGLYGESKFQPYNLASQICVGLMFFFIGYSIRSRIFNYLKIYIAACAFVALFIITMKTDFADIIIMSWSVYPNGFIINTLVALMCIYACFFLAHVLSLFPEIRLDSVYTSLSQNI